MAKVIPIGQPVNDSERRAIAFLRDHLSEDYVIIHNFEFPQGREVFEIDIAILGPHAVYLVDVKGTHGLIDVYGSKWYPEDRPPFHSPLAKLRKHAKVLAALMRDSNPANFELHKAHVQAAVLLTADDAQLSDDTGIDGPDVTDLKQCLTYFNDKSYIPPYRQRDIRPLHSIIVETILGKARPRSSALCLRDWQVEEKLGGDDHYTEYRAKNSFLGKDAGIARLRVYQVDPYQDEVNREAERKRISNAFVAVAHMSPHPNVLIVRDFFQTDDQDFLVLVTEDVAGQALRQHIQKSSLALTFNQKLQVMRDMLSGLDHAHKHEVIHRNLTPDAVIVTREGRARITAFDYARVGKDRESTIAGQIINDLDEAYQAPECYRDPAQASIASDLYSAGLIFFELLTCEHAFENIDQMMEGDGIFPIKPSEFMPDLPEGIDGWLQKFCVFDPEERHHSAALALKELNVLILPEAKDETGSNDKGHVAQDMPEDLTDLPLDFVLGNRFRVQKRLGTGGFGVAYKVFDSLGDVTRVIKLVTRDRQSVYQRLRREYKTLTQLPDHPHVVKVIWADRFNDVNQTPYIVFEYIEGLDVSVLIDTESLSLEDAVQIVRQAAEGLEHLHKNKVYHLDVKPSNLLWTDNGVRIIDFNVAVSEKDEFQDSGGTRRYIPPDYNYQVESSPDDYVDRDLYSLGITFYECLTDHYPFDTPTPPQNEEPKNPKQFKRCENLSPSLINSLSKLIAPKRKDRYASVEAFLKDFNQIKSYYSVLATSEITLNHKVPAKLVLKPDRPNFNPFVNHLLTLYSQSQISNAGTRGLDDIGKATYVPTYLDENLIPSLLKGEFRLVIITGNAGDGKTAFIQQFEQRAVDNGAQIQRGANGAVFQLKGHTYQSNYDGSQDEGDEQNDLVLQKFFAPFKGEHVDKWPANQTRIIAINEGRLVDFFHEYKSDFPLLEQYVEQGLAGGSLSGDISIINLNLRSVVAKPNDGKNSILERLIQKMTEKMYWAPCESCDLKDRCYAFHNAQTFQDPTAGPKVIERLKMLYTIVHLQNRLHITMRDLRSSLAFMLVGTRDCDSIHQLYQEGGEEIQNKILGGFYFNSWMGGNDGSEDRLISMLRGIDVSLVSNPELDRQLGFLGPNAKSLGRFSFSNRPGYDNDLLTVLYQHLPFDYSSKNRKQLMEKHRDYIAHLRRRYFFEQRNKEWRYMLPYKSIGYFLSLIQEPGSIGTEDVAGIIQAINLGEGLNDPSRLDNQLALRVRKVERGTIRSYRLFDGKLFSLFSDACIMSHPFLEFLPQHLTLRYEAGKDHSASLTVNLDVFEMLTRLNKGYRPSVEEEEGYYLSLSIFKNVLAAAPYQEVLLTENGYNFFQIRRDEGGVLHLAEVKTSARADL